MSLGRLIGVGVGPGAPDLLTLRALNVLRSVPVLALPRGNDFGASVAWEIIKQHLPSDSAQERLFLTFPMVHEPSRLNRAWSHAQSVIGERLLRGQDVAFATEGDPSLFSSFIYLKDAAPRLWPGVAVEVVPAVSSITAVAAVAGVALADGQERIAILPGTCGLDDLEDALIRFDTIVLMKVGGAMPHVVACLEKADLLDRAVYVSRATMQEQRIVRDLRTVQTQRGDCFAMVVIAKKERNGVLRGDVPRLDGVVYDQ